MIIKNILSIKECELLHKEFLIEKEKNQNFDYDDRVGVAYGFRPSNLFNEYMNKLKPTISEYIKSNNVIMDNVNTYIREYKNGSFLKKHIDRNDIGITLSICLYSNINKKWPLCLESDGTIFSYDTEIGDGVLLLNSNKVEHWRDELICNENEYVLQFFIHWKLKKGNKSII